MFISEIMSLGDFHIPPTWMCNDPIPTLLCDVNAAGTNALCCKPSFIRERFIFAIFAKGDPFANIKHREYFSHVHFTY